jgi:uncharacterized protein
MNRRQRCATLVGLVTALGASPVLAFLSIHPFGDSSIATQVALQSFYCALVPLIIWITLQWERQTLRSIGLRRFEWSSVAWGLALCAGTSFVLPAAMEPLGLVALLGADGLREGVFRLASYPLWFLVLLGATGGIVEETLYRGYAIERLAALTGRLWLGGAISAVVFTLAHVPFWGLGFAIAADLPFAVVMTGFYLWRRDLLANAIAHSIGLVIALPASTVS